jgi:hypothetical protein
MAPSTLGKFLRAFTFGHVRQLDAVIAETIRRAWRLGAGPDAEPVTIDLDSTICEVHGKAKHGAAYGYTKVLGYHPLLATRADTGEVLHARLRKGSSQRGTKRFAEELIARVRRAGATGALTVRADAGFWNYALINTLTRLGVTWSITVRINPAIRNAIDAIDDSAWTTITYPDGGEAQVAETVHVTGHGRHQRQLRLVVRRTRLTETAQRRLWPTGATTPSSPTSSCPPSPPISSTATTQPLNSPSAISKKAPVSSTAPRDDFSPMPPGSAAPCSLTT